MAGTDRRSPVADDLANALLTSQEPVPFDDLADRGPVSDVAGWVGNAVGEGLVEEIPAEDRKRRFRLRPRGAVVLTKGRRSTDT